MTTASISPRTQSNQRLCAEQMSSIPTRQSTHRRPGVALHQLKSTSFRSAQAHHCPNYIHPPNPPRRSRAQIHAQTLRDPPFKKSPSTFFAALISPRSADVSVSETLDIIAHPLIFSVLTQLGRGTAAVLCRSPLIYNCGFEYLKFCIICICGVKIFTLSARGVDAQGTVWCVESQV